MYSIHVSLNKSQFTVHNTNTLLNHTSLLHFLPLALLISRLTPQPDTHKRHPPGNRNPYTSNPHPPSTNLPAARPFIVSEMPNRHFSLYINIGQKRSLVIDAERKDAMLVWKLKCRAKNGAVGRLRYRYKV